MKRYIIKCRWSDHDTDDYYVGRTSVGGYVFHPVETSAKRFRSYIEAKEMMDFIKTPNTISLSAQIESICILEVD